MNNTMNIASVKLINSGKKGLLVIYSSPSSCKGATSMDALKHARKFPIHWELENAFKDLRSVLLDVCDYSKETREKDIQDTTVNEVIYGGGSFSLKGVKTILDTDKEIPLTPKDITADDYSEFEAAVVILDTIYKETKAYMAGEKEISDEQLILRFNEGNAEFDTDSLGKMSAEEKRDFATKILEDQGHVVIHTGELGEEAEEGVLDGEDRVWDDEKEEEVFIEKPNGTVGVNGHDGVDAAIEPVMEVVKDTVEEVSEVDEFDYLPPVTATTETKKTTSKKSPLSLVDGPNGAFKIVAAEPQQSTAKRVAKG